MNQFKVASKPLIAATASTLSREPHRLSGTSPGRQCRHSAPALFRAAGTALVGNLLCLASLVSTPALAQSSADSDSSSSLQEVTVTGFRFLDQDTSGITNLPLPIQEVPQSISVLNNDFVKAADLKNMGEVAQYTTGALWASYSPSYGNQVWLRGFAANYAIDGLTVGDQITEPDPAILERYEMVKGPASVVYGAQSPGGIVDLVSKNASPGTPSYLEALGGSWGRWRVEGQTAGALDESGSIRGIAVAAHEQGGSFVDFVKLNKTVVYGGLDFDLAEGLTGYARASYQYTEDTPFNGVPPFSTGLLPAVGPAFFVGASEFDALARASRFDTGLSWRPSELWSVDLKGIFQYTTHGGRNAYPYSTLDPYGSISAIGGENFNDWKVYDFTVGASAIRKLDDLGLSDSSVSASVRYQHYRYSIFELGLGAPTNAPEPNIYTGDAAVSALFNELTPNPDSSYQQDQVMKYLTASSQAVIKVAKPLMLVGGVAYSQPSIDEQVNFGSFQNFNPGGQVKYRGALVLQPTAGLNLYASYSESYLPNLRVDTSYNVLPPLDGAQYELGTKYLSAASRVLVSASVFDIRESNVAVFDRQVGIEALYTAEDVRHRGIELEATGRITNVWQLRGGLALLDPKVTDDPESPVNNGEIRPWLPRVTANFYTLYSVTPRLSLGGGGRFMGAVKTYDSSSPLATPSLSSYVVLDASADYSFDHWQLQLNLKNLLDKAYYVSTPLFQSLAAGLYPGEPRSVAVSARRDF